MWLVDRASPSQGHLGKESQSRTTLAMSRDGRGNYDFNIELRRPIHCGWHHSLDRGSWRSRTGGSKLSKSRLPCQCIALCAQLWTWPDGLLPFPATCDFPVTMTANWNCEPSKPSLPSVAFIMVFHHSNRWGKKKKTIPKPELLVHRKMLSRMGNSGRLIVLFRLVFGW